jgi:flagellar hook assembly protein FlgD/outer membrane protein OmpA-like peptidoglycan-associated protein
MERMMKIPHVTFLMIITAVLMLISPVFVFSAGNKDVLPPDIDFEVSETTYISPLSSDGVQDTLEFEVSFNASEKMVIKGYRFVILNESGEEVFAVEERDLEKAPFGDRLLIGLGFYKRKEGIEVPDKFSWTGIDTSGIDLSEGSYSYQVEAWDDKGRHGKSPVYALVIDNTDPSIEISTPYSIFSPNNDGNKDILIIEQKGSVEDNWKGTIFDLEGNEIISFFWDGTAPENTTWNGQDSEGNQLLKGTYSYLISTTDDSGNTISASLENIIIDTRDTPITLTNEIGYFSPNDDGSQDILRLIPDVPVKEGIKEWTAEIHDTAGAVLRTYTGVGDVLDEYPFDGKDDMGLVLPEGLYRGFLSVLYTNGNNPATVSPEFEIDLTAPSVSVKVQPRIFSPNGDGNIETIQVYQETSLEDAWLGTIEDTDGNIMRSVTWRGKAEPQVVWDGTDAENNLIADGKYTYTLSTTDRAGNYSRAESSVFEIDTRITPVSLNIDGTYFSPNRDGIKDTISILPLYEDPIGIETVILSIENTSGDTIRRVVQNQKIDKFAWDGKNDQRKLAIDSQYMVTLEVLYFNGNNPVTSAGPMIIDTVHPQLNVSAEYNLFSPDNDGNLDTLTVYQNDSSDEVLWSGSIQNSTGDPVKGMVWKGTALDFTWDGKDEQGNRLPDGRYSYLVASTDQAGNSSEFKIPDLTIDTRPTPVTVKIGSAYFSPNGDGQKDQVSLMPELEIRENIESWTMAILDSSGRQVRLYSGGREVPGSIDFDGRNSGGSVLPEGPYRGEFTVLYKNGSNPSEKSAEFTIDLTAPSASVSFEYDIFSPDADTNRDSVKITQSGSQETQWQGQITDKFDRPVRTFTWFGSMDRNVVWDGKDDNGKMVSDGSYAYRVSASDQGGNTGKSNSVTVQKDTTPTPLTIRSDLTHFSPNNDTVKDRIKIYPEVTIRTGITSYDFSVIDRYNSEVYSRSGTGAPPSSFLWNGKNDSGSVVPDGQYRATINLVYEKGNEPFARSSSFSIDTEYPEMSFDTNYTLFSPDGDGRRDVIIVKQESSTEDLWEGAIISAGGRKVKSYFWKGRGKSLSWNGADENGNPEPDGEYIYRVTATDKAGNTITRELQGITVDTRTASAYVSPAVSSFSPNGDGYLDNLTFNLYKSLEDGITGWSFSIVNMAGTKVRTYDDGNKPVPLSIEWDGKDNSGRISDGTYSAVLRIEYEKGNIAEAESSSKFILDITPPSFVFSMDPKPFSPDDDGVEDTTYFNLIDVDDVSPIDSWQISIIDPGKNSFYEFAGAGDFSTPLEWDGTSLDGELVEAAQDYTAEITMMDILGNSVTHRENIPIDVLVFREGANLKIRISSIQFAPNLPDFLEFDEEKAEKNIETLTRLAVILQKYNNYQIRVEGHAVSVFYYDEEKAEIEEEEELQPLSQARAEAVRDVLVDLGIDYNRMTTVGMGGTQPVVPHSDLDNRWKSRRVEFILIKQ